MSYDYRRKKIVAVLAANLDAGVAFNVIGHLAISVGAYAEDDLMGRPQLVDASGISHVGISKYPFIITKVKAGRLSRLIREARQRPNVLLVDYPEQMLSTGHDDELAQAISSVREEDINYLGAILFGDYETITELTGKFSLWR
jgi:hypothetical protein